MFTINNKSCSSFKAKLLDREITSNEVVTIDDWLDGAIQPVTVRQQEKFKTIRMTVLIEGSNEDDAYKQFSKLTAELKNGTLKFTDMALTFKVIINGSITPNRLKPSVFEVEYTLKSSYGYASETSITREAAAATSFTITNVGTAVTPCIVEITPTQNIASITLKGLSTKEITIRNITTSNKVVIDGEKGTITMAGKNAFNNYNAWEFPRLKAGSNTVTVGSSLGYSMKIRYSPRYI